MTKLYINSRKYAKINALLLSIIAIFLNGLICYAIFFKERNTNIFFWVVLILGFVIIVIISKSRPFYLILERTDEDHFMLYNNLFGKKMNACVFSVDAIREIRSYQDQNRYYNIEIVFNNGQAIHLEKMPIKDQSDIFKEAVVELLSKKSK